MQMRHFLIAALVAGVSAPLAAQRQSQIQTRLPVSRAEAFAAVSAAFIDEGLVIDDASESAGLIRTTAAKVGGGMFGEVYAQYRANIVGDSAGSRVVLSGTYYMNINQVGRDPSPIESGMRGTLRRAWEKLEAVASRLTPSPAAAPADSAVAGD